MAPGFPEARVMDGCTYTGNSYHHRTLEGRPQLMKSLSSKCLYLTEPHNICDGCTELSSVSPVGQRGQTQAFGLRKIGYGNAMGTDSPIRRLAVSTTMILGGL